ncbi:hypothetical protein E5161_02995 [Cohnella pontilimi]|uniref:YIEGIA protein n=2 Tax=Cohnella pontilimi TaxID=2564100 RepID=A0A4U0FHZ9_9BACL|nr:YIEGIA family protein [Cohnella pontilimi]TJY44607.1 hypothetical protein E5161_02995 [Cohnella pontilimi]
MHTHRDLTGVLLGTLFGLGARLILMRSDYRQYPAYPHGRIVHIALGLIAAALGSVAVPSLYHKNYTAITFLSLAAQQFREVRNMERTTLNAIDKMELVPRGAAYIEGIAVAFEGRNYLAIFAALITSMTSIIFPWWTGLAAGFLSLLVVFRFMRGKTIRHIADVQTAPIRFDGHNMYVGDVYLMNVGLKENREIIEKRGIGIVITPKNGNARVTIANLGQRQAILYDVSTRLGVYRDTGEPLLIPLGKLALDTGQLALVTLPREYDPRMAIAAVESVPLLEAAVRMPVEANRQGEGRADHG